MNETETFNQFLPLLKYEGKHILAYKGDIMSIKDYTHFIREAYERGEYVPDNYEDLEAFLSLDPSERQDRVIGSYANEDMYDQAMEEGVSLWHEEN